MISLVETNISFLYPSSMILDGEYAEVEKRSFCYNEEVSSSMKSWWIQNRKGGAAIPLCHIHIMVLVEVSLPDFDEIFNLECEWDPCHPKKGFEEIISILDPDFVCLQETKAQPEQIDLEDFYPYEYINSAKKKGYSGTMIMSYDEPLNVFMESDKRNTIKKAA